MDLELTRVESLRAANVCAVVSAVFMGFLAFLVMPIMIILRLMSTSSEDYDMLSSTIGLIALCAYIILGLIVGWISGFVGSLIYNLVTRFTGGFQMQFRENQPQVGPANDLI